MSSAESPTAATSSTGPHHASGHPPVRPSTVIPSLDGLRAVSIAIVFASHLKLTTAIPGGFGVTVFFFLSGFLITTLLTREFDKHGRIDFRAFYMRRVIRLSPPLLVTMALAIGAVMLGFAQGDLDIGAILSQVFFFYNYYASYAGAGDSVEGFAILWSLSVEEHFYFLWPLVFLAIANGRLHAHHVVTMLAAVLIWRCLRHYYFGADSWVIYRSTDTRIDSLLYGCLLALVLWRHPEQRILPSGYAGAVVFMAALAAIIFSFLYRQDDFRATFRYSLQGVALIPIFYYTVRYPDILWFRWLNWGWVRRIGVYSYTLYLCHNVTIGMIELNVGHEYGAALVVLSSAALSLTFAALVYEYVEKPLHPLRRRFTART